MVTLYCGVYMSYTLAMVHRPPIWYLRRVDLFADLSDEAVEELITGIYHGEYPCKHILYTPADKVEDAYILKDGEVTLYQKVKGKTIVLDILKPGSIFGNVVYNAEEGSGHFAEVTQNSFVCTLPKDFFLQLTTKHPTLALNILKTLTARLNQYQTQLKLLSVLSARERLLVTIDLLAKKDEKSILPALLRRPTKVTHEKLANMTGLTRETVTKQLQELESSGLIEVNKKHIELTEAGKKEMEKIL